MSRIKEIEPIVRDVLVNVPVTRDDNFMLYAEVLTHYIDVKMPFAEVCAMHKELGIPSLETITRVRRKIQEREPELASVRSLEARKQEEQDMVDYAMQDKVWY